MGSKKSKITENINEGRESGREGIEAGRKLEGEGKEIKQILDSIDTSMDEDDVAAVRAAETGYHGDFTSAADEQIDPHVEKMNETEQGAIDEATQEGDKTREAAGKFEQMEGVSEVGSSNAREGAEKMESSAEEYDSQVEQANQVIEEIESEAEQVKSDIDSTFS